MSEQTIAAAPSAETVVPEVVESQPVLANPVSDEPSGMSDAQYNAWRLTGKMPSEAESAPAEEDKSAAEGEKPEAKPAAESEPAKPSQEHPKKGVKARNEELDRDIQDLQQKLRTRAELRKQMEADGKAESSPASAKTDEYKPLDEETYFKENPDKSFTDFINAAARHEATEIRRQEKAAEAEATRKAEIERVNKEGQEKWSKQYSELAKEVPDLDKAIFSEEMQSRLEKADNMAGLVRTSDHAPRLLHALSKNMGEFDRILAIRDPYVQAREIFKFEQSISGKKQAPAAKPKIDDMPPPPRELGNRGSSAKDEIERAIEEGDQDAYNREMNRRDAQRLKGK